MEKGNSVGRKELTLTIVVNEKGGISVHGPVEDKILCFGLLEAAKLTVAHHNPATKQTGLGERPRIIVPEVHIGKRPGE